MKKIAIFLIFLTFSANSQAMTRAFPVEIDKNFESPRMFGGHHLKIFGFFVYDIHFFVESKIKNRDEIWQKNYAISIDYGRNFSKKELIEASIDEIKRIKNRDEKTLVQYEKYFDEAFVDVKKGDRKTVIVGKDSVSFFYNGKLMAEFQNRQFGVDFVDIWLDERAEYEKMRRNLLQL